ncbi:MAG: hypothetical protein INR71_04470 [Terriglobus roseus]|nr:hypothetical protein [Terriglobus roseus]
MEEDREETNLTSGPGQLVEEEETRPKQPKRRFVGRRAAEQQKHASKDKDGSIEDSGAIQGRPAEDGNNVESI